MLKTFIRQSISQEKVDKLRKAKIHFNGMVNAFFQPVNLDEAESGRALYQREAASFLQLTRSSSATSDGAGREALKRTLMERVSIGVRYEDIFGTDYIKSLIGDQDTYNCVLAAVHYASGEINEAIALLESAIKLNPTPFNYLSLSRCASHGLGDDRRAIEMLESALGRFPGDFPLILSMATAHFRLGNTDRANEYLDLIQEELKTIVQASNPNIERLQAEISTALEQKLTVRPKGEDKDAYAEGSVEGYWSQLWYHMRTLNRFQHGWSRINDLYQEEIGAVLAKVAPDIQTVINFGVFCAEPDYELAKRFPQINFFGVDRETRTKELNDKAYQAPNLTFLAADIMDVLPELAQKGSPSLLFHARTATLLYPEFLRTFYRSCAAAGIKYIALWENASLSRATLRFHDFDNMPADSIPYGSVMFIHNYKKILGEAGYEIIEHKRKTSNEDLLELTVGLGDGHQWLLARRVDQS